jgi:hypothetical protein
MKDQYDDWLNRVVAGRKGKPLNAGEVVGTSADTPEPFAAIEFAEIDRPKYFAEVGKKGGDYVYHFYPKGISKDVFEDKMGDALLGVFKNADQLEAVYTEELNSWAVRARGFASNIWGDDLAVKVFDKLDSLLGS